MQFALQPNIPEHSLQQVLELLDVDDLEVKLKNERKTRHGDYRKLPNGKHQITINSSLNKYRFLITLLHEIAHFETYQRYGRSIKPHGKEWKLIFQHLMLPFLNPNIFPKSLLPLLANHIKNPKASSDTDQRLSLALKQFDETNDLHFVFEVPLGKEFKIYNGKIFRRGAKRIKRFECLEIKSGRTYLFNPNAEVEILD
ncbi:MAG: sprT domain-containing protein [Flavobacteriaceae bacterium]|nr:SprT-like domain-containing protein [Bacteroidia bacterium]NNL16310.1 sprT domain-containing protein [Flavobacteriaceae bacterium]